MGPQTQLPINTQQPIPPQPKSKLPLIIGGLILILIAGLGSYYLRKTFTIRNSNQTPSPTVKADNTCVRAGCNKELCVDQSEKDTVSTCVADPKYECYDGAVCEKQNDGQCGWTQTNTLKQCLKKYQTSAEGKFCGGIAGIICPEGYDCKYDGKYPDAGGKCVKKWF